MRISLRQWVKDHRAELDEAIQRVSPGSPQNDRERALWVLNDEGLYLWAKAERVNI